LLNCLLKDNSLLILSSSLLGDPKSLKEVSLLSDLFSLNKSSVNFLNALNFLLIVS